MMLYGPKILGISFSDVPFIYDTVADFLIMLVTLLFLIMEADIMFTELLY